MAHVTFICGLRLIDQLERGTGVGLVGPAVGVHTAGGVRTGVTLEEATGAARGRVTRVERRDTHVLLRFCAAGARITMWSALRLISLAILDYVVVLDCSEIEQRFPFIALCRVCRSLVVVSAVL